MVVSAAVWRCWLGGRASPACIRQGGRGQGRGTVALGRGGAAPRMGGGVGRACAGRCRGPAARTWYVEAHSTGAWSRGWKLRSMWRMLSVLTTVVMPRRVACTRVGAGLPSEALPGRVTQGFGPSHMPPSPAATATARALTTGLAACRATGDRSPGWRPGWTCRCRWCRTGGPPRSAGARAACGRDAAGAARWLLARPPPLPALPQGHMRCGSSRGMPAGNALPAPPAAPRPLPAPPHSRCSAVAGRVGAHPQATLSSSEPGLMR